MMRFLSLITIVFLSLSANVQAEDTTKDRAMALIKAELVFKSSVFSGDEFPSCDFAKPGQMRERIGDYTFEVTFYDRDYGVVEKPSAAGRYGAVVKIKAEDGSTYTRFRTLYKSPQRLGLFYDQIEGELKFPQGMVREAKTLNRQRRMVSDYGEAYRYLAIGKQHKYNGTSLAIGTKILEQMTGLTLPELYKKYHRRFIKAVTDGIQR